MWAIVYSTLLCIYSYYKNTTSLNYYDTITSYSRMRERERVILEWGVCVECKERGNIVLKCVPLISLHGCISIVVFRFLCL